MKFCADLLYLYRKGVDLTFIVPLYPGLSEDIKGFMMRHYPDIEPIYIHCQSGCGAENVPHVCEEVLAPWRDIEHINVCPDAFDYSTISECEQCQHIKPDACGYAPPKADGTQGKVWNYFIFMGMTEKEVSAITHRHGNCLTSVVCPFRRDKIIDWWKCELTSEGA